MGGEEFIVLLPNTKLDKAYIIVEQIRENISKKSPKIKKTGQALGNITVSAGVSEIREGDTAISVVERADSVLYISIAEVDFRLFLSRVGFNSEFRITMPNPFDREHLVEKCPCQSNSLKEFL